MNVSNANTADEMRAEVVAYFDNLLNAHDREVAAMNPRGVNLRAEYVSKRRRLEVHREFFASLMVSRPEPSDREIAIGEHAFKAGYNTAAQRAVNFAPTVVRDWAAHRETAWSEYTPPEFD